MRLVKPGYKIFAASNRPELPYSYDKPNNLIEVAGRTCYKSEEKITEDSSEKFVQMLKNNGHCAMIEHSWETRYYPTINLPHYKFLNFLQIHYIGTLVSGNIRAFDEWDFADKQDFKNPGKNDYLNGGENELNHIYREKRWDMLSATVKLVCDRGVTHEQVRHRPPAYAQESTRWCNYCQDRFGQHLAFAIPIWLSDCLEEGEYNMESPPVNISHEAYDWFDSMCYEENKYFHLVNEHKWIPGRARSILPNSLKTEIVVTADLAEWQHIFSLRTAPNAHEQMRELMIPLQEDFKKLYPEVFV